MHALASAGEGTLELPPVHFIDAHELDGESTHMCSLGITLACATRAITDLSAVLAGSDREQGAPQICGDEQRRLGNGPQGEVRPDLVHGQLLAQRLPNLQQTPLSAPAWQGLSD